VRVAARWNESKKAVAKRSRCGEGAGRDQGEGRRRIGRKCQCGGRPFRRPTAVEAPPVRTATTGLKLVLLNPRPACRLSGHDSPRGRHSTSRILPLPPSRKIFGEKKALKPGAQNCLTAQLGMTVSAACPMPWNGRDLRIKVRSGGDRCTPLLVTEAPFTENYKGLPGGVRKRIFLRCLRPLP